MTNIATNATDKKVVLAYSGGLDTSFCVPYLLEQGYEVTTVFVDSGGITPEEKEAIEAKAYKLGAVKHIEVNITNQLWEQVVIPLIQSGQWYQNQYPLLCSDRYLIVESCLKICDQLGTKNFAHGCTGMGNDQVRFDLSVQSLGDYNIISPIREIQKMTAHVRDYEIQFLHERGHEVEQKVSLYSINTNLLGATISGSEIDQWQQPGSESYVLTNAPENSIFKPCAITLEFNQGILTAINDQPFDNNHSVESQIQKLNHIVGKFGVGRGIYTGDTTIGIKGRIVFEAPALHVIHLAHTALEQAVLSKSQNRFKSLIGQKWSELVYEGLFYEPLKNDLEAFLYSSQNMVSGVVTINLTSGQAQAVSVCSENILIDSNSVYAQSASWNIEEAVGFIKLFGKSSVMAANRLSNSIARKP